MAVDSQFSGFARNPHLTMFRHASALARAADQLRGRGYDVRVSDASRWVDGQGMHRALAELLDFPDYYGRNLDALNDCLGDLARGEYGVRAGAAGLALVLQHFDVFAAGNRRAAIGLLDIVTDRAPAWNPPMLCLVQWE